MKKSFILKLLAFILIFATLLPLAVACKKDPPPNDDDGDDDDNTENGGEQTPPEQFIDAVLTSREITDIANFDSEALINRNSNTQVNIKENLNYTKGETTYKLTLDAYKDAAVTLPAEVDISSCHLVEFNIYSDASSGASFTLSLSGLEASVTVVLDFVGMKTYRLSTDQFTVKNPMPKISSVVMHTVSGAGAVAYISSIRGVKNIYTLSVPEGVSTTDPAIYKSITDRYIQYAIGNEGDTSPEFLQKIAAISESGKYYWDNFNASFVDVNTPDTVFAQLWFGLNATPNEKVMYLYQFTLEMAKAYAAYGGTYYKNPELLTAIKNALEYGYNTAYGKYIVETGITTGDWYHWDVPIPKALIETLILIESDIDYALIPKYLEPFDKIMPIPQGRGGNKLLMGYNVILAAALERDAMRLCMAKEFIYEEFDYIDKPNDPNVRILGDGGPYSDGSYIQHGSVAYTAIYGMALLNQLTDVLFLTDGSPLDFHGERMEIHYDWVFNNFNSVIYEGQFLPSLYGRGIGDTSASKGFVVNLVKMRAYADSQWKTKLDSLIKYYFNLFDGVDFTQEVPVCLINDCKEIYSSTSIVAWQPTPHAEVFGAMDRAFQYGTEYGVSISLSSTRVAKYESINTANETGWYHGDGMIYIHTGDYLYDNSYFFWAEPHLMPGTTVNTSRRNPNNIHPMIMNADPYAGGAKQDRYAAVGYIMKYDPTSLGTQGAGTFADPQSDAKITAKKSYFLFDDEIICIGTGINDFSGDNVLTVVENRAWGENDVLSVNGSAVTAPVTPQTTLDARTMHFTNMGGYVFLRYNDNDAKCYDGALLRYQKASHNPYHECGTSQFDITPHLSIYKDFLEITLDHGVGDGSIEASRYAYAYLPTKTAAETEEYYANPDVQLLSYSENVHAVVEKELKIIAFNYFVEGSEEKIDCSALGSVTPVTEISADTPCSVMISTAENGEINISAADPTHTYSQIVIYLEIDGLSEVVSKDDSVNAVISGSTLRLTVNTKNALGATFDITVK